MRTILAAAVAVLLAVIVTSCMRVGLDPRTRRGVSADDGGSDGGWQDADAPDADLGGDGDGDADGGGDGDGDADLAIDGDVDEIDGDIDWDVGLCDEDPCRLVAPQCGCPSHLACQRPDGDDPVRECVPPGPVAPLEACSVNEDCTTGYVCVSATGAPGMCVAYCFLSSDCPTHSVCAEMIVASEPVGSCSPVCDPLTGAGCHVGGACIAAYVRRKDDDAIVPGTMCGPDDALPAVGESCASLPACQQGSTCVSDTCQELCVMASPDCPAGTSCGGLSGGYSLVGVEYGTCR